MKRYALTDGKERVLQLQGERGQRNFLRHGQHGHSGQVGGRIAGVPFTARRVQRQITGWKTTGAIIITSENTVQHDTSHASRQLVFQTWFVC